MSEGTNTRHNPLNIKAEMKQAWVGQVATDGRGHAVFADDAHGVRAALRTLDKKWQNGKRTLEAIIREWAPASDTIGSVEGAEPNDPDGYAASVARRVGMEAGEPLPEPRADLQLWAEIIREMSRWENGAYCPWVAIYKGIILWWDDFAGERGK
jgi:hypothetical protein